jgi:uncharacterized OsmC-like protein
MAQRQTASLVNGLDLDILHETIKAVKQNPELGKCRFRAINKWIEGDHNRTTISDYFAAGEERTHKRSYEVDADEPSMLAGGDEAPNPTEHLLSALAGCMTTSLVVHAAARGIQIEELESEVEGDIDLRGFLGLSDDTPKGYTNIRMKLRVKADVDNLERIKRLAEYSPTFNTLIHGVNVDFQVEPK